MVPQCTKPRQYRSYRSNTHSNSQSNSQLNSNSNQSSISSLSSSNKGKKDNNDQKVNRVLSDSEESAPATTSISMPTSSNRVNGKPKDVSVFLKGSLNGIDCNYELDSGAKISVMSADLPSIARQCCG